MLLHEAQRYLDSFVNYEAKLQLATPEHFNLKRVELLLEKLGNPHKKLNCLHVAGTNGKGSVCAFSASILQHLGYKIGLYTSPHLWDIKERIRILDPSMRFAKDRGLSGQIAEEDLCTILEDLKPSVESVRQHSDLGELSFFEIITVAAFCYFYQQETDYVVLETGLGGRLDATNVVEAGVCGLTSISLEHTQQLGNTLAAIAKEKVAIVKTPQQRLVVVPQAPEVMMVIEDHCAKLNIKPVLIGKDPRYHSPLLGEYQAVNMAMAVAMVELLLDPAKIDQEKVKEGIRNTSWPGRFEIIRRNPAVVLDGAHNPAAARELSLNIKKIFPGKRVILILGLSADKNKAAIAQALDPMAECVILTRSRHARAAAVEELKPLFAQDKILPTQTVSEAMELALQKSQKEDVIVVAGSLFVVAEARKYL